MTARPVDSIAEHCVRLWGLTQQEGYACLAHGVPHLNERGGYAHQDFAEHFVRWPQERTELYRLALELRDERDVWLAPVLRTERRRVKTTAGTSRFLYGEIDRPWTQRDQMMFDNIAGPGSFLVASGGEGRRHLYVRLDEPVVWEQLELYNRRLAAKFGGDSKWDASVLLRLPGTFHHKGRVRNGDRPVVVDFAPCGGHTNDMAVAA